jgi:hypothetical protein
MSVGVFIVLGKSRITIKMQTTAEGVCELNYALGGGV